MDPARLEKLLGDVRKGRVSVAGAMARLRDLPFEDLGFARVDHHRALRQGMPEVIFGPGKTREQIAAIAGKLRSAGHPVVVTRIDESDARWLRRKLRGLRYSREGRLAWTAPAKRGRRLPGRVLIVAAGTSDLPVAEEAAITIETGGAAVERLYDVGVAGAHRLFAEADAFRKADVVVAVAGMDGVLPSVIGGWIPHPVIAVPTSVGYGASLGGLAALLTMLTSCASGITVVNVDNGFGAATAALRILRSRAPDRPPE